MLPANICSNQQQQETRGASAPAGTNSASFLSPLGKTRRTKQFCYALAVFLVLYSNSNSNSPLFISPVKLRSSRLPIASASAVNGASCILRPSASRAANGAENRDKDNAGGLF